MGDDRGVRNDRRGRTGEQAEERVSGDEIEGENYVKLIAKPLLSRERPICVSVERERSGSGRRLSVDLLIDSKTKTGKLQLAKCLPSTKR